MFVYKTIHTSYLKCGCLRLQMKDESEDEAVRIFLEFEKMDSAIKGSQNSIYTMLQSEFQYYNITVGRDIESGMICKETSNSFLYSII